VFPKAAGVVSPNLPSASVKTSANTCATPLEAKLWIDALDETSALAEPKARALGIRTEDDVFKLFS